MEVDILGTLKEVQATNKFIQRRLAQLTDTYDKPCICECHSSEESTETLQVKTQVQRLEDANNRSNATINELKQQLNQVQEVLKHLADREHPIISTMPINSDVSKKCVQSENGPDSHDGNEEGLVNPGDTMKDENSIFENRNTSPNDRRTLNEEIDIDDAASEQDTQNDIGRARNSAYRIDVGQIQQQDGAQAIHADADESQKLIQDGQPILMLREEKCDEAMHVSNFRPNTQGGKWRPNVAENSASDKTNDPVTRGSSPQVLRQRQRVYKSKQEWDSIYSIETREAQNLVRENIGGLGTVICVDISESMSEHDAWTQARQFIMDYIHGLMKLRDEEGEDKEHVALVTFGHDTRVVTRLTNKYEDVRDSLGYRRGEHVALVTFGHDTRVVTRLTNKYEDVRDSFESIKLGGPSPLVAGLKMGLVAAGPPRPNTQMFLITDGKPTPEELVGGPDDGYYANKDEIMAGSLQIMEYIPGYCSNFYCVAVGKADMEFLEVTAVSIGKGQRVPYTAGEHFSRRTVVAKVVQLSEESQKMERVYPFLLHNLNPIEKGRHPETGSIKMVIERDSTNTGMLRVVRRLVVADDDGTGHSMEDPDVSRYSTQRLGVPNRKDKRNNKNKNAT